ncbi:Crp/Fnr family transcriptional regulator [Romboutsia lituseburensis]|uniref:CRP/FNR family transcriptional regulator, anaerobic regulatory protein n=1 Tax=Romboutsia lituseburensis DSM 797 TaxID=1121325 RepID=A0A1G9N3E6_9FIRM|nr:Crp/Fnr family transcriptional regulator [Romboutsia lituseburensis]CEH34208.1 Cyclic nucleotide-binding domain protein [Romboutsia lituseburensis]SDL81018.1 CRP/FNR family transcriptional regulator, anaerobic regulatory protein [Romboutsia lituseburensis DSM 797]
MNVWSELINLYPFLDKLNAKSQTIIKNALIVKDFNEGYTLIHEGASCLGFSLIIKGSIRVYKLSDKGREATLYKLNAGDTCYLSMSCMLSEDSYPAFAEVLEQSIIVFIPSNIFNEFVYNTLDFQKYIFKNLYSKFNDVLGVLEEIAFERIDVRVAKYLLLTSQKTNNSKFIYLTQEKIAQELGTSREVISRMLTDFKNKEIITSQRGKITILDFEKLKSISSLVK